jgi:hypothetical protein
MHTDESAVSAETVVINGEEMLLLDAAIVRLRDEFPEMSEAALRALLTREWEAATGGWPVVIPAEVAIATRRVLRIRPA